MPVMVVYILFVSLFYVNIFQLQMFEDNTFCYVFQYCTNRLLSHSLGQNVILLSTRYTIQCYCLQAK